MGKNNNIIHINGKRYDARTGAHLDAVTPAPARPPKTARNIDGVRRPAATHTAHHAAQPAKTLRRDAVHKPTPDATKRLKAHSHTGALAKQPDIPVLVKPSVSRLDATRLKHAKHVPQSKLISRFGPDQPAPHATPLLTVPQPVATQPLPAFSQPVAAPVKRAAPPTKPKTTADLLQHALDQATSHTEQPVHRKRRSSRLKQITGVSAAALSLLVIVTLTSNYSLNTVRFKMASAKAGFSVSNPGYQPSGFSLSDVQSNAGVAAAHYHSNSDDRSYTVTQKASNWDSQGLRDGYVAFQDIHYRTVQAAGRTIYLYGNNATWVSGGIWYLIQGNGALTSAQLTQLASSL